MGGLKGRACPCGDTVPASMMKKHTEALLEEAIIDHLTAAGGYEQA